MRRKMIVLQSQLITGIGHEDKGKGQLTLSVDATSNLVTPGRAVSPIRLVDKVLHGLYATSPDIEPIRGERNTRPLLTPQRTWVVRLSELPHLLGQLFWRRKRCSSKGIRVNYELLIDSVL